MAKIVLSDKQMSGLAAKEFKYIMADIKAESLLKDGCSIDDLVEKFEERRANFIVRSKKFEPSVFDKQRLSIKRPCFDAKSI